MYDKLRDKMRAKIRTLDYVMTLHAEEEMENDRLSILDVESAILNGEIVERQRDIESGESKYLVTSEAFDEGPLTVVVKLAETGKLVIITVYREENRYEN